MLPRPLNKLVLHAHLLSPLLYAAPVWAYCISSVDARRLDSVIYRALRQHCFDFNRTLSNQELCQRTGIRSFKSLRVLADTHMLHNLCTLQHNTVLLTRLLTQSYTLQRFPNRVQFFDFSSRRIGKSPFINRAKFISELIPFCWIDLATVKFKMKMKIATPIYMRA